MSINADPDTQPWHKCFGLWVGLAFVIVEGGGWRKGEGISVGGEGEEGTSVGGEGGEGISGGGGGERKDSGPNKNV